nr:d-lactate dehydrogenase [cytochrome], mitochondrial [Quercus suber]
MSVDMDGTVSGEHGIGLEYRDKVVYELGESSVDAMRCLKLALDPLCLLNPGKMIRMEPVSPGRKFTSHFNVELFSMSGSCDAGGVFLPTLQDAVGATVDRRTSPNQSPASRYSSGTKSSLEYTSTYRVVLPIVKVTITILTVTSNTICSSSSHLLPIPSYNSCSSRTIFAASSLCPLWKSTGHLHARSSALTQTRTSSPSSSSVSTQVILAQRHDHICQKHTAFIARRFAQITCGRTRYLAASHAQSKPTQVDRDSGQVDYTSCCVMDPQSQAFTPHSSNNETWRLQSEVVRLQQIQTEHSDRLARLERRQDDDARMKSVWGTTSPFPSVLSGTPQQGVFRKHVYLQCSD